MRALILEHPWRQFNSLLTIGIQRPAIPAGKHRDLRSWGRKPGSGWESSTAHRNVLRADLNLVEGWDALAEGRILWLPDSGTSQSGVGYNFGSFSDDLRDLTLNDQGIFVNLLGKW